MRGNNVFDKNYQLAAGLFDRRRAGVRGRALAAVTVPAARLPRLALGGLRARVAARAAVRVVDDAGDEVALPRPAQRIVSLAPHATEMLFAAGAGSGVIVVRGAHSDWPPEARALPRVADAATLDLESIVALQPDLVVAWPYTATAQLAALRALGPARVLRRIRGRSTASPTTSRSWRRSRAPSARRRRPWRACASASRAQGARIAPARALSRVLPDLATAAVHDRGSAAHHRRRIKACGGDNVFARLSLPAPAGEPRGRASPPQPEAIVAGADDAGGVPPWLATWQSWPALPAVRAGNVFVGRRRICCIGRARASSTAWRAAVRDARSRARRGVSASPGL